MSKKVTKEPAEKTQFFKKWWFWLIVVIVLGAVGSAGMTKNYSDSPSQNVSDTKEKLTLDDGWTIDNSNKYFTYVDGYVSNNTDKAIDNYISITFIALDADGATVGNCYDNANFIDANGKWKFHALCTGDNIKTVKLKEVSGF